jgi:type VI protein secretion system component Hcp
MAVNTFLTFFDKADGESILKGKERWVEVHGWDWEVEAATSWTKGGGASVGKPRPGELHWYHPFDTSSTVIMGYICTGSAFPKVELQMTKPGPGAPRSFFTVALEGVYITKVALRGGEGGSVFQDVEMVFKTVRIDYRTQDEKGGIGATSTFNWDIPAGTASPSA